MRAGRGAIGTVIAPKALRTREPAPAVPSAKTRADGVREMRHKKGPDRAVRAPFETAPAGYLPALDFACATRALNLSM